MPHENPQPWPTPEDYEVIDLSFAEPHIRKGGMPEALKQAVGKLDELIEPDWPMDKPQDIPLGFYVKEKFHEFTKQGDRKGLVDALLEKTENTRTPSRVANDDASQLTVAYEKLYKGQPITVLESKARDKDGKLTGDILGLSVYKHDPDTPEPQERRQPPSNVAKAMGAAGAVAISAAITGVLRGANKRKR